MDEDEAVRRTRRLLEPRVLDPLGVDELRAYIAALREEIARAEAEIGRKEGHLRAADAFFKRPAGG